MGTEKTECIPAVYIEGRRKDIIVVEIMAVLELDKN